ncbi:MAG: sensor histidine kinase, partial [Lachnospiraceae bacterium]|nr:sensor histidine kinase [Lachnospiraceae bacterium]
VEHSEPHGEIRVQYGKNPVYSYIRTENYGDPIDPEDLPHIFERFYKGKNATPESIGIGLALAKTIVEEDGGVIEVDSDGARTQFVIKYIA